MILLCFVNCLVCVKMRKDKRARCKVKGKMANMLKKKFTDSLFAVLPFRKKNNLI